MIKITYGRYIKDDGGRSLYFPKSSHNGDCVIRACAIATGRDYLEVMKDLFRIGLELGDLPNGDPVYSEFLKRSGFTKNKTPKDGLGKGHKIPIREWVAIAPSGSIVATTRNHVVAIVDNVQRDAWLDERCVNSFWHREK
jgi:hypothetical protein